ncbi:MAG: phosphate acetyltransferase [Pseudomonadota bacterium]
MDVLHSIIEIARHSTPRIVLSEGDDPRVAQAAARASHDKLAQVIVVAKPAQFERVADGAPGAESVIVMDPAQSDRAEDYANAYFELRRHKGLTLDGARKVTQSPLGFAAMMLRHGDADGTLGGAVHTTADTVRAALQIVGKAPGVDYVSSCFLMLLAAPFERPVVFADCGLILQPTAEELTSIALASAETLQALTGETPRIAMLSFSTMGSVAPDAHESINRLRTARDMVRSLAPDLIVDGEIQFDAAILPEVAGQKAPDSILGGQTNVFVFPSLSAGNIGYKIAQRLGRATALGPILQGLAHPANDLSRGCSSQDVYQMIAITAAQASARRGTEVRRHGT